MTQADRRDSDALFARLDALGIRHSTMQHAAVFTVEESRSVRGRLPGAHVKNLFLRDKKRRMWLLTALEHRAIDLKDIRRRIGASGSLSFGSPELLMEMLGVTPGLVTPFGVINDRAGAVTMLLDKGVLEQDPVHAHPLRNDMTTALSPGDLLRFLEAENHAPALIDFDAPA
ncbi:MAG: prolyl-tRNA synthetase associated domain-containing protein [Alphaproteobacteria bacterium]